MNDQKNNIVLDTEKQEVPLLDNVLDIFFDTVDVLPYTDKYFTKTEGIIDNVGAANDEVTYAVFMRRPVRYACGIAIKWLKEIAKAKEFSVKIQENYTCGDWVGAGEPLFYYTGKFINLVELETLLLQMVGMPCVCAYNAYEMAKSLLKTAFLAMEARHCTGKSMMHLAAYGAAVGSMAAKRESNAIGFIGNANDATSLYFNKKEGLGTMPHALIGYAGSTLEAAKFYHKRFPQENLTVLNDYFGREVSDSLEVCNYFKDLANEGKLAFRTDTHGGRYIEGLDTHKSYAVLERNAPEAIKDLRGEHELRYLLGTGVSAAAIWYLREKLDEAGFTKVKLVASSGFSVEKCKIFSIAKVPVDIIGTGTYLPENWQETYTTADIVSYNGNKKVKAGREFLFSKLEAK